MMKKQLYIFCLIGLLAGMLNLLLREVSAATCNVNGDGRDDIVGFGSQYVYIAIASADGKFSEMTAAIDNFAYEAGGWRVNKNPRLLGDVDGDGKADVVGFGNTNVYFVTGKTIY